VALVVTTDDYNLHAHTAGLVPSVAGKGSEGSRWEVNASIIAVADG
jgi:hypothetical protein